MGLSMTSSPTRARDLPSFVRVAYIHNASYLGGLIGLVTAIIYLRKQKR
jgi:hypothetical protein